MRGFKKVISFIGLKRLVRSALVVSDSLLIKLCGSTRFGAVLYYFLFNRSFDREVQAVLCARSMYKKNKSTGEYPLALLRRNIHRLEKGLIMRPRRGVFGEAYIEETVNAFLGVASSGGEEAQWAGDVLLRYFSVVKCSEVIDRSRKAFSLANYVGGSIRVQAPYPYSDKHVHACDFDTLTGLFQSRRSVRWFKPELVEFDVISQSIEAALQAPSACNRQPFSIKLSNGVQAAARIASYAGGTAGYAENIRHLAVIVGHLENYPYERDRHLIYIDGSLFAMQFILALESFGVSSCIINWPDVESREKAISVDLSLEYSQRPIMLIAFGYADESGGVPYSSKKSVDSVVSHFD